LGGSGTLQNSQCRLNLAASSAVGSSNNLALTLAITFKSSFQGSYNTYMYAHDNAGLASSWQQMGTWTVPGASQNPTNVSVSPSSGSGMTQTFTITAASSSGYRNLDNIQFVVGSGAGCYFYYITSSNVVYLNSDGGSGWVGNANLGGSGTLQNSQCSLNLAASSAVGSSNNLALTLAITFKSSFQGSYNTYMYAHDNAGLASSWQQMGTWTP
jgi:hypothetical protein